ncbi:MAG: efflux RND transporter periplasmic adaptor subunit [Nitrospira sp.]|nr:efflux RND transporter periplasmic adaptor subunit [Nitrospira sp.]
MYSGFVKTVEVFVCSILLILLITILSACSKGKSQPPPKQAVPVTAATVVQKTVPVQISAIGNVEAYSTVSVKSQMGGVLTRVHFKEGQDVYIGDILFTIDPRPYEAALKQAEANLAKDTAQLENARVEARRYGELVRKGYVAQEQYDQIKTNAAALEATVTADRALVENARLQLKYCYIYSPINGRTGNLIANEGNLIKANGDNPMVVINQIQPVYVSFSVPEQYLAEIKEYMSSGKVKVEAIIAKDEDRPVEGVLTFVDNAVDTSTGTIKLKATFGNKDKCLWPGQFVNVVMILTTQPNAVIVPLHAIQTGQKGQYVFLIKNDLTVESRSVVITRTINNEAIVEKGLQSGDKVVTDGQLRLVPGAKVEVKGWTEGLK